ncbi:hypothetical protein [Horticoccus sp. 23ND18S-11]|uniref:hypothetical protein n=1 Tax=Horticoccus sp. 23ND18S-11 TaxID=3391832 RepID=UPI0039C8C2EC
MNSSDQYSKLPAWIFIATDLAFIGAALAIATLSPQPLSGNAIIWIVICIALGALVGLVPIVAFYERRKNETLDERQRALEALARTVHSSAEQISIAANGLHEIAELALKNLRMAEHLPHKLQDKIAEFQAQLAAATDADKEELERELLALRTTESERLESVAQRIAKSSAEWTKLEAATHQHLTAANEAVGKLALGTASAITNATVAAEQALTQARVEAARTLGDASGKATRAIETARTAALADFDARIAAASSVIVDRVLHAVSARLGSIPSAPPPPAAVLPPAVAVEAEPPAVTPAAPVDAPAATDAEPAAAAAETAPALPRRPRKPRREENVAHAQAPDYVVATPPPPSPSPEAPAAPTTPADAPMAPAPSPVVVDEPAPVPVTEIPEITPVAPETAEPFTGHIASRSAPTLPRPPAEAPADAPDFAKVARKRPAKRIEDDEPGLGLDLGDANGSDSGRSAERVLTSDGATRLIATAYIGIGNRLFIRGDGPGLSWEKGVPLQFVSIGKWRWETNDATGAVQFKLYKNDEVECAALGTQSLDPGYQQEVTAGF